MTRYGKLISYLTMCRLAGMVRLLAIVGFFFPAFCLFAADATKAEAAGQLQTLNGYMVLSLKGTPEEMGAMGKIPAFRQPFKTFQWTKGLEAMP